MKAELPEWRVPFTMKGDGWVQLAGNVYVVRAKSEASAKRQVRKLLEERFPHRFGYRTRVTSAYPNC